MEKTIHRFDREGAERYVCELQGAKRTTRSDIYHLEKVHNSPNAQQKGHNHGIKSPSGVAVITNQGVNCGSTFADRPAAQNHVVKSGTRGSCKKDRSHGICSLEEVTQPISCNLCAHEFGDLHVLRAHARLTHKPFPAPTIRASQHAQLVRQPRRHRQHSRDGHERGPRVHQEGRRGGRGAATPTAAPTNRQPKHARLEETAARRQWWSSPKQTARSSRSESTKSWSTPSPRRIIRCETCRRRCGTL